MIKPFKIDISNKILEEIKAKVKNYPWHEMPDDGGWEYGTNLDYLKELSDYWVKDFNWKKHAGIEVCYSSKNSFSNGKKLGASNY